MYKDMDKLNMASVFDKSMLYLLWEYGEYRDGTEEDLKRLINIARKYQMRKN